ncbi:lysis protein [Pseudomonas chlororaphis]|uniref:lysis system i-spanin subunit Rz n=1 Tax=Pseudomonas chlororaphis TaxID=587753 RepID=UPI00209B5780|nr:lysis system i-spanin subunit Rz [Pseudomonas chlororaphis]MCO7608619.1 lysis protein [Pseudomonas chlororaphis]
MWQANAYGKDLAAQADAYSRDREQAATAVINWQETQQDARRALEDRLQANDETHYKELHDAQTNQDRLRDRLATADLRLSVLLNTEASGGSGGVSATAAACGVVHGGTRAELDPAAAQRIVAITGDGDQGLIALAACQDYVRGVVSAK